MMRPMSFPNNIAITFQRQISPTHSPLRATYDSHVVC